MPPTPALDAETLLAWYAAAARDLPWRRPGTTPWGVLVSEVMLQQTPVARVAPIWEQWLARWPDPASMAASPVAEVLRAWGRLGYPRRAVRLHSCAVVVTTDHGGVLPDDVETLLTLPGVGAYTARAVVCFAHGGRVPVVDTNVRRVVARAEHGRAEAGPPSTTRDLAETEALLPEAPAEAAVLSAALMELGATVCTARSPACGGCPVRDRCAWVAAGRPAHTGPVVPKQRFAGTDRQVRGLLLGVVRSASEPVGRAALDVVWPDAVQRDRALGSLLLDGLLEQTDDDRYALPGEGGSPARNASTSAR
ncbi:A/G-specific adenine glycosylase [Rhodococcus aerolatus]